MKVASNFLNYTQYKWKEILILLQKVLTNIHYEYKEESTQDYFYSYFYYDLHLPPAVFQFSPGNVAQHTRQAQLRPLQSLPSSSPTRTVRVTSSHSRACTEYASYVLRISDLSTRHDTGIERYHLFRYRSPCSRTDYLGMVYVFGRRWDPCNRFCNGT